MPSRIDVRIARKSKPRSVLPNKRPDECPSGAASDATIAALDPASAEVQALFAELVRRRVTVTSTLTVFETFTPGRPIPPGLQVLDPLLAQQFTQRYAATQRNSGWFAKNSDRKM